MFVKAIENVGLFTRPIHVISKSFKGTEINKGAATLFLLNKEGYALTCKHVVEMLRQSDQIAKNYRAYKKDLENIPPNSYYKRKMKKLMLQYNLEDKTEVHQKITFVDCVDQMNGYTVHVHPTLDLAIIKFNGFSRIHATSFAVFKKDTSEIKQGKFLCRLGFPFPEFTNFHFNETTDELEWLKTGIQISPRFPVEGMITRFLADKQSGVYGIEMSTPGLRGQSGGPLFDSDGLICGMQSKTKHLHLGFDIEQVEIMSKGQKKTVNDYSFIHLGECIHVDVIKKFLKDHQINFEEE